MSTTELPATHTSWARRQDHSFSKRRTILPGDIEKIRAAAFHFLKVDSDILKTEERKFQENRLDVEGADSLFRSSQTRLVFSTWMGRVAEPIQTPANRVRENIDAAVHDETRGDNSPSTVPGDALIITLARADAYLCSWLAITVRKAETTTNVEKLRVLPPCYNILCQELLPQATCAILNSCRDIFKAKETVGGSSCPRTLQFRREMEVPYTKRALSRACVEVGVNSTALNALRTSPSESEVSKYNKVCDIVDAHTMSDSCGTRLASSHDNMDNYMACFRKSTYHFLTPRIGKTTLSSKRNMCKSTHAAGLETCAMLLSVASIPVQVDPRKSHVVWYNPLGF